MAFRNPALRVVAVLLASVVVLLTRATAFLPGMQPALAAPAGASTFAYDLSGARLRLDGAAELDRAGFSLAGLGDLDGDGRGDFAVAAPEYDIEGRPQAGVVYVVSGGKSLRGQQAIDLAGIGPEASSPISRVTGAGGDAAGWSVAAAGDVDGDGRGDLVVGAPFCDPSADRMNAGCAYVIFGAALPGPVDLAGLGGGGGSKGFRIDGAVTLDLTGWSVAGAGDVDGDGLDDVVIGAPYADAGEGGSERLDAGSAYVVFGKSSSATVDLAGFGEEGSEEGYRLAGGTQGDHAGLAVAVLPDIDGGGRDEVVVGAPGADPRDRVSAGAAYVALGQALTEMVDLRALGEGGGPGGFRIDGAIPGAKAGSSLAAAGDINGDGREDLLVGSPGDRRVAGESRGAAHVLFVGDSGTAVDLEQLGRPGGSPGFPIYGAAGDDEAGYAVAGAGDVDGDGLGDLLVGAPGADPQARADAGAAYLVSGKSAYESVDLGAEAESQQVAGAYLWGAVAGDEAGHAVAGAGDVDGDGRDDLLVGAVGASRNGRPFSGSAYLFLAHQLFPVPDPSSPLLDPGAERAPSPSPVEAITRAGPARLSRISIRVRCLRRGKRGGRKTHGRITESNGQVERDGVERSRAKSEWSGIKAKRGKAKVKRSSVKGERSRAKSRRKAKRRLVKCRMRRGALRRGMRPRLAVRFRASEAAKIRLKVTRRTRKVIRRKGKVRRRRTVTRTALRRTLKAKRGLNRYTLPIKARYLRGRMGGRLSVVGTSGVKRVKVRS